MHNLCNHNAYIRQSFLLLVYSSELYIYKKYQKHAISSKYIEDNIIFQILISSTSQSITHPPIFTVNSIRKAFYLFLSFYNTVRKYILIFDGGVYKLAINFRLFFFLHRFRFQHLSFDWLVLVRCLRLDSNLKEVFFLLFF